MGSLSSSMSVGLHVSSSPFLNQATTLTRHGTTVDVLGEFVRQVLEHVQASVRVRLVGREQDRPDKSSLLPSILGSWCAMQIDHDGETHLAGPLHSLNEMRVLHIVSSRFLLLGQISTYLARDIWFVIKQVNSPVTERNANRVFGMIWSAKPTISSKGMGTHCIHTLARASNVGAKYFSYLSPAAFISTKSSRV